MSRVNSRLLRACRGALSELEAVQRCDGEAPSTALRIRELHEAIMTAEAEQARELEEAEALIAAHTWEFAS